MGFCDKKMKMDCNKMKFFYRSCWYFKNPQFYIGLKKKLYFYKSVTLKFLYLKIKQENGQISIKILNCKNTITYNPPYFQKKLSPLSLYILGMEKESPKTGSKFQNANFLNNAA